MRLFLILLLVLSLFGCNYKNKSDRNVTETKAPSIFYDNKKTSIDTIYEIQLEDNMRGFDPASEDDMEDNGLSRYLNNNDEVGWN